MYSPWQWQPLYIFPSDSGPEMASVWEGRWCRLCRMSEWQSVKRPGKPSRPRHETHFWIEKVWSVTHFSGFYTKWRRDQAKRQMRSRSVKGTLSYSKSPSQSPYIENYVQVFMYVPSRSKQIFYLRACQKKYSKDKTCAPTPQGVPGWPPWPEAPGASSGSRLWWTSSWFCSYRFFVLCYGYYVTGARLRDVKKFKFCAAKLFCNKFFFQ